MMSVFMHEMKTILQDMKTPGGIVCLACCTVGLTLVDIAVKKCRNYDTDVQKLLDEIERREQIAKAWRTRSEKLESQLRDLRDEGWEVYLESRRARRERVEHSSIRLRNGKEEYFRGEEVHMVP